VLGRDHGYDALRTYRVDRIEGCVDVVGAFGAFDRPTGFDPRTVFPTDAKQFGIVADRTITARVRIDPERAALVAREVGSERVAARRRNGAIEVVVPADNGPAFASWVFGLADHAEVLSPKKVREEFVERLRRIAKSRRRRR
jgi:predicted DNA-binding transcriptional regulator YafY